MCRFLNPFDCFPYTYFTLYFQVQVWSLFFFHVFFWVQFWSLFLFQILYKFIVETLFHKCGQSSVKVGMLFHWKAEDEPSDSAVRLAPKSHKAKRKDNPSDKKCDKESTGTTFNVLFVPMLVPPKRSDFENWERHFCKGSETGISTALSFVLAGRERLPVQ